MRAGANGREERGKKEQRKEQHEDDTTRKREEEKEAKENKEKGNTNGNKPARTIGPTQPQNSEHKSGTNPPPPKGWEKRNNGETTNAVYVLEKWEMQA